MAKLKCARWTWLLALVAVAVAVGCRSGDPAGGRPKPGSNGADFADKVDQIEPGLTTREQVETWFGEPTSVEELEDGGASWQLRHTQPVTREGLKRCKPPGPPSIWRRIGDFVDGLFYLPRQPAREVIRRYPARIHQLELLFTPEGVVDDLRYQRFEGVILCSV